MGKIECLMYTFFVYSQKHICYCENTIDASIWAEGAIHELSNYAYINSTEIAVVTMDEFNEKHYTKISEFTRKVNVLENEI